MEHFFAYETAKETVVLTAYWLLLMFDVWWFGFLMVSLAKWVGKKIKILFRKKNNEAIKNFDVIITEKKNS